MAQQAGLRGNSSGEGIASFMARREREVERLDHDAEAVGRAAWGAMTRAGLHIAAATPSDLRALGARVLVGSLAQPQAPHPLAQAQGPAKARAPGAVEASTSAYGAVRAYEPSASELAELRRQQAEFAKNQRLVDRENSWMAVPALAPAVTVMALEGGAALAARLAGPQIDRAPLQLVERDPYLRVGDNWATRAGRRAHQALRERLEQKSGWDYEPKLENGGGLRPDVGAPARNPLEPDTRRLMELKPNTPSGRRAAAKATKRYFDQTGNKTRAIYYDPTNFI